MNSWSHQRRKQTKIQNIKRHLETNHKFFCHAKAKHSNYTFCPISWVNSSLWSVLWQTGFTKCSEDKNQSKTRISLGVNFCILPLYSSLAKPGTIFYQPIGTGKTTYIHILKQIFTLHSKKKKKRKMCILYIIMTFSPKKYYISKMEDRQKSERCLFRPCLDWWCYLKCRTS